MPTARLAPSSPLRAPSGRQCAAACRPPVSPLPLPSLHLDLQSAHPAHLGNMASLGCCSQCDSGRMPDLTRLLGDSGRTPLLIGLMSYLQRHLTTGFFCPISRGGGSDHSDRYINLWVWGGGPSVGWASLQRIHAAALKLAWP
eukprot:343596-Chlamydomonas_euryale.AAC.3